MRPDLAFALPIVTNSAVDEGLKAMSAPITSGPAAGVVTFGAFMI